MNNLPVCRFSQSLKFKLTDRLMDAKLILFCERIIHMLLNA